jgi:hypothetical protein
MLLPFTTALAAGKPVLSQKTITILTGKTTDLDVKYAAKGSTSTWSSSNKKIATVNKNGIVKGISKGTVTITCKVKSAGKTYNLSSTVTVILGADKLVIQNKTDKIMVGDTIDLKYILTPSSSNDKASWETSNKDIASIDSNGKLSAKKVGELQVKATSLSGATDEFTIKIEDENTTVFTATDLNEDNYLLFQNKSFENVYLANSLGDANVKLDTCNINGTLTLEAGAAYGVEVVAAKIDAIKVITPGNMGNPSDEDPSPAIYIRKDTVVNKIALEANCYFDTVEAAGTDNVTIAPKVDGIYNISLDGYQGNISVDYKALATTRVELVKCAVKTVNINNASGDIFLITSNEEYPSTVDTINQNSAVTTAYDVTTKLVNINKSIPEINLLIASPINRLVHNGSKILFMVAEEANLLEVVDNKNSEGNYGNYCFCDCEYGEIAFTLKVGDRIIEGIRVKDFAKILEQISVIWTDKSKPFAKPEEEGVYLTSIDDNNYIFDFNGNKVTLGVYIEESFITLSGGENIIVSNIGLAKDKDNK